MLVNSSLMDWYDDVE